MSEIARAKEQVLFAKLEIPGQEGTLAMPSQSDCVVMASSIKASQDPSYSDSPEIQNTRGVISRFKDALSAGEFSFTIVPRPNAAGEEPVGGVLFQALMGKKTPLPDDVSPTSWEYSQTLEKPSFSICYRKGHVVYYCLGATVSEMGVKAEKKGPITLDFSGKFMNRIMIGDDETAAAAVVDVDTDITVTDGTRFTIGGYVYNPVCADNGGAADDNGGAGYKITAIAGNVITLESTVDFNWALAERVEGFLPAQETVGTPLEGRDTVVMIDSSEGVLQSIDLTINDPCEYLEDEINSKQHPTEYVEGDRKITGSVKSYFRKTDSGKLISSVDAGTVPLSLEMGSTRKMIINLPNVPLEVPKEEESGPSLTLSQSFTALEGSGEDSATITFS